MAKYRNGQKLKCEPCGREVVIDDCGASSASIWCCGRPMRIGRSRKAAKATASKK